MDIDSILSSSGLDLDIHDGNDEECDSISIHSAATTKLPRQNNPVEEHLNVQLNCIQNQIDIINSNIEVVKNVTGNTIKSVAAQAIYNEDSNSESDNDLYTSNGEPILKKRKKKYEKSKVLVIHNTWQKVIDDKWIIGVELENTMSCVLKDPTIYICLKDGKNAYTGVSVFWFLVENQTSEKQFWYPTNEIYDKVVATAVLDLPTFDSVSQIETHGIVICENDDKLYQTPLPEMILTVENTVNGSLSINFDGNDAENSLLALKVISIDRVFIIPGADEKSLRKFLKTYEYDDICNVCILRKLGSLQNCILEIYPPQFDDLQVLISARSEAQLTAVVQLLKKEYPEVFDPEKQQMIDEAAEALEEELKCYLNLSDKAAIQRAKVKSDLLIP